MELIPCVTYGTYLPHTILFHTRRYSIATKISASSPYILHQICSDIRFSYLLLVNPLLMSDNTRSELFPGHIVLVAAEHNNLQKPVLALC